MKSIYSSIAVLLFFITTLKAQTSIIGGKDYGLASSSVMWMPNGASVFLNPAELGRVHQDEFLFSTNHFRNMGSMVRTFAAPFTGTFAAGIANQDGQTIYSFGYGSVLGSYHTIGASTYILSREEGGLRFSVGNALHFPFSGEHSGIHTGLSFSNLPGETKINAGIALWAISDWLRFQANIQNRIHRGMLYGAEFLASDNFSFVFGTRAFKSLYGGVSIAASTYAVDITAGPAGLTFSLNIIIGESAQERRSISYEDGYNLFSEKRYTEANEKFLLALEYDEYDNDSRTMAETSLLIRDSLEAETLNRGMTLEENFDFPGAINTYSTLLRLNPANTYAETLIVNARYKMADYVNQLIATGDTLKNRKDAANARKNYELALKYDPQNDIASSRIDDLENLSKGATPAKENSSKENVGAILARAQSLLSRKQFDNAQKEYERVLSLEPRNSRAKAGLNAIQARLKEGQIEVAKSIFDEGKYFEALTMMLELAKQNIKNKDLESYIETAREKLQPEVEKRFKTGLTYYATENYDHAITVWDQALLIQPRHAGILEYRKRAEDKMKALEKLK